VTTPQDLPGWAHAYSGKVRDLYVPADLPAGAKPDRMLVVATDRISSFDHVLEPPIPGKGELLTTLSLWWFDRLAGADAGAPIPNHVMRDAVVPEAVHGRAMVVTALDMLPVECVVRGYLTGSGWGEYQASQTVCGIHLPDGLHNGDRLPAPIFTPAYKAPLGEHDENITFDRAVELIGAERAERVRELSLQIYERAARTAQERGLILADTKFEFGVDATGTVTLADEVLTADSSRYWDADSWRTGTTPAERMASFDKQIVRDWLAANWPRQQGRPPRLPDEIVARTAARYRELIDRLAG